MDQTDAQRGRGGPSVGGALVLQVVGQGGAAVGAEEVRP